MQPDMQLVKWAAPVAEFVSVGRRTPTKATLDEPIHYRRNFVERRELYFGLRRREHFQVFATELHVDSYRRRRRRIVFRPEVIVDVNE
jgi:hypothetical protein